MSIIITNEEYLRRNRMLHGDTYSYIDTYHGAFVKHKIKCNICNFVFEQIPNSHWRGRGCPECRWKKCGIHTKGKTVNLTLEKFLSVARSIHGDLYDYSKVVIKNSRIKVCIICPKHGEFWQSPSNHLHKNLKQGCPKCRVSKGEIEVKRVLDSLGIEYDTQHRFDGCKGKRNRLPFDFYLINYNAVIEYDGVQHYRGWRLSNDETQRLVSLQEIQARDDIKTNFCRNNNIKLLRIHFRELEKGNVERFINEFIQTLNIAP